jgi:c-di-GMP-binding flagellar brake protein YcgR
LSEPRREVPPEIITARSYIAALLQRAVSERLLVSVTSGQANSPRLTSTVLQVLPNEGAFLLDDLFPQSAPMATGSMLTVEVLFEGASLRFSSPVDSLQEEAGLRLWRIAFPESVEYRQARNDHRVVVASLAIPVRIFVGEGGTLTGELQDICTQGIAVCLSEVSGLKRGRFYRCSIDHRDDESVEVEIEPSRIEKVGGALPLKLGLQLHNMSKQEQMQWQRFAVELERRLLRKH